jgi:hypothetical protein
VLPIARTVIRISATAAKWLVFFLLAIALFACLISASGTYDD